MLHLGNFYQLLATILASPRVSLPCDWTRIGMTGQHLDRGWILDKLANE